MNKFFGLGIALLITAALLFIITSTSILQRVSYDIYECSHRTEGKVKLWFRELNKGAAFDFTWNGSSKMVIISAIEDGKITFEQGKIQFTLDKRDLKLIKDDLGSLTFFYCDLNEFRM